MKLLYIAGPLRSSTREKVEQNIAKAKKVGIEVWERGHVAHTPHLNTYWMDDECTLTAEDYIRGDLLIVERCDGVVMLPGWSASEGAIEEYKHAIKHRIPVWFYPNLPEEEP